MRLATGGVFVGVMLLLAGQARAQEPGRHELGRPADVRAEERRFERAIERFTQLWSLTQELVAEHERREFERASAQYERFAALTRELAQRHAAEEEQDFEQAVTLYLRKRELTRTLTEAHAQRDTP